MKFLAAFLLLFLMMSCGILEALFPIDNFPQRYIDRKVTASELTGTWQITSDSESRINAYLTKNKNEELNSRDIQSPWKTITLNKDGTCQILFEISWDIDNKVLTESDALSTCTWEINSISGYDESLSSKNVPGLSIRFDRFNQQENMHYLYFSTSYIVEENNELVLWSFIGDLTHVNYQDFKKVDNIEKIKPE